jgi:hypothetical protein
MRKKNSILNENVLANISITGNNSETNEIPINIFEQDKGFLEKLSMVLASHGFKITGVENDNSLICEKE